MSDVIAYVEVRTTNDNRSEAIRKELENLGAMVTKKFTDDVTHVIFKEGSKRTKTKAMKNKCHLVSVLWVDRYVFIIIITWKKFVFRSLYLA